MLCRLSMSSLKIITSVEVSLSPVAIPAGLVSTIVQSSGSLALRSDERYVIEAKNVLRSSTTNLASGPDNAIVEDADGFTSAFPAR